MSDLTPVLTPVLQMTSGETPKVFLEWFYDR